MPLAHLCFVSAEGTVILGGCGACFPRKILQNYTQIYAISVLSGSTFKVIFV